MGERAFSKIQWGKETTGAQGTAVAADTILMAGIHPPVAPDRVPEFIEDDFGVRVRSARSRTDQFLVRDSLSFGHAYYQLLPILYSMSLKGSVTPAEQTSGESDYLWDHSPSLVATNNIDSGTIELGDDVEQYEREYMMIERLRIAGVVSQGIESSPQSIEVDYFARQNTAADFTAALTIPTTEQINAKLTRFYLDTSWAGVGGTEKTGLLRSYDVEILTGLHPKFMGGANQYFDTHGEGFIEVLATFVFEGNSDADAIFDAFNLGSLAVIELNTSGAQIGAGGNHQQILQFGGKWERVVPLGEVVEGNNLHQALLHGTYDITGADLLNATVKTNVASI
jgi:hypothetical protein